MSDPRRQTTRPDAAALGLTRRELLRGAAAGLALWACPAGLARAASAGDGGPPVLVTVFLRGGADGLQLVVPHGDPDYAALRPSLGLPRSELFDIDGFFGLHPALAPLWPLFDRHELALLHAVGSPQPTRSHFDAQDFLERGSGGDRSVTDGWLNRALLAGGAKSSLAGVTIGPSKAAALVGAAPTLAFASIDDFRVGGAHPVGRAVGLGRMYGDAAPLLAGAFEEAAEAHARLRSVSVEPDVAYPPSPLAASLREVAALVKAEVGLRAAAVDSEFWDTHVDESHRLPPRAADLAESLAAFWQDLGPARGRTGVLVVTEFGRRAAENGNGGTDHGTASAMAVLGSGLAGGRVLLGPEGWPGLAPDRLFEGLDLAPTLDARRVFAEILDRHLGIPDAGAVFPGVSISRSDYPGLYG